MAKRMPPSADDCPCDVRARTADAAQKDAGLIAQSHQREATDEGFSAERGEETLACLLP
jgi:hypothetical protein